MGAWRHAAGDLVGRVAVAELHPGIAGPRSFILLLRVARRALGTDEQGPIVVQALLLADVHTHVLVCDLHRVKWLQPPIGAGVAAQVQCHFIARSRGDGDAAAGAQRELFRLVLVGRLDLPIHPNGVRQVQRSALAVEDELHHQRHRAIHDADRTAGDGPCRRLGHCRRFSHFSIPARRALPGLAHRRGESTTPAEPPVPWRMRCAPSCLVRRSCRRTPAHLPT